MTKREREIMKKYTRTSKWSDGSETLFLSIDHQEFGIETTTKGTRWYRKMLAIALTRMIDKDEE